MEDLASSTAARDSLIVNIHNLLSVLNYWKFNMIDKKQIEEYREAARKTNAELTKEYGEEAGFDKELTDEEIIKLLTDWEKEVEESSIKRKELIKPFTAILDELKKYSDDIIKNALDF